MIRNFVLVSVAALAFISSFDAALAQTQPAIWQGAYLGAAGGRQYLDLTDSGFERSYGTKAHGVFGGYNLQFGSWVLGGEMDWTRAEYLATQDTYTFRARGGYAVGSALFYGTVGYGKVDFGYVGSPGDIPGTKSFGGLAYGGGVEAKLIDNFALRAEVLHIDMGTGTDGVDLIDFQSNSFRIGVSYLFK